MSLRLLLLGSPLDSIGAALTRLFGASLFWLGVPVWSVSFVWLNKTNQINQINQTN